MSRWMRRGAALAAATLILVLATSEATYGLAVTPKGCELTLQP